MALSDKDILITPNRGQTDDPKIEFKGADASLGPQTITARVYPTSNGTLSFEGSAGQLFSITNDLSGTIFSVNDVSGIPSIEVLDDGTVKLAEFGGTVEVNGSRVLTVADEGSGNSLDADTVDGIQGSSFLRSDANDTFTGILTNNGGLDSFHNSSTPSNKIRFGRSDGQYYTFHGYSGGNLLTSVSTSSSPKPNLRFAYSVDSGATLENEYILSGSSGNIWHSGNDGSGSGLDADTVDGIQGSAIVTTTTITNHSLNPRFATSIGFGNDIEILKFVDNNGENKSGYWASKDGFYIAGDGGSVNSVVLKTGNLDVNQNAYVVGKLGAGSFEADKYIDSSGRVLTYDFSTSPSSAVGDNDGYFDIGEALELFSFAPTGNSQNYYVEGTVKVQKGGSYETLFIRLGVRSNLRPDLSWSSHYERYSEVDYSAAVPYIWANEIDGTGEIRLVLEFTANNIHDIECSFKVFQRSAYGEALTVLANHRTDTLPTNFSRYNVPIRIDLTSSSTTFNGGINAIGNVGIGTSSPAEKLHVSGSTLLSSNVGVFRNTPSDFWGSGENSSIHMPYGYIGSNGAFNFSLYANGYRNTSGTWTSLETSGSTSAAGIDLSTQNGSIGFRSDATKATGSTTTPTERMRITSAGNVGIGTSSPQTTLHIRASQVASATYRSLTSLILERNGANEVQILSGSSSYGQIRFGDGDSDYRGAVNYRHDTDSMDFVTTAAERMRIDSSGNVGIGTSSPAEKLHVVGDIVATGNVTAFYSDERLKNKVGKIKSPLEKVNSLSGFYYTNNELAASFGYDSQEQQVGLSAQEVESVLPEIVSLAPFDMERTEDGELVSKSGEDYKTVDYAKLVPLLVEAIKELTEEVRVLKSQGENK